jgi:exodeoxyribonuclease VII large subunit
MTLENRLTPQFDPARQLGLNFDQPAPARRVWAVNELVAQIREWVENKYDDVWVEGEISNCRPAPSGHIYFTLKDADAQLPVVLFRRQAQLLRFRPGDGLHVLVRGRVSIYEQRGQMQLVAEVIEPVGAGSLQLAFEQLRERLKAEGLFDTARKRPLPTFPRTAAIVTSPTGAVVRDFLNIVGRRHSGLNVLLYPVSVQGESAPAEIEAAIAELNASALADLIVLARGGGSLEDLAAFNSERVARAIVASRLPVVSAVGHETDFTIADFAADLRAPTPSAAAELITDAQYKIGEQLTGLGHRLERGARFQMLQARQCWADLSVDRAHSRLSAMLHRLAQRLDDLVFGQESTLTNRLRRQNSQLDGLTSTLLRHDPRQSIAVARHRLLVLSSRLERCLERNFKSAALTLGGFEARLHSLSPLAVLDRGYALVFAADARLVRSAADLSPGQLLTTRLSDGSFSSRIEATMPGLSADKERDNRSKS